ncbi:MAG: hypothetical protein KKE20_01300, partial [Nanoarchaeota archaeon]|nr:hypothetical protein [Nanoarchaeota archaeon]
MIVIHEVGDVSVSNESGSPCFILTNKAGGYLSFSESPISRYQGAFFNENDEMFKIIENIFPVGSEKITQIKNRFYSVERTRGKLTESFMMPLFHNSIVYELSEDKEIEIVLDAKKAYDNREFGRFYSIKEKDGKIIIEYTKKTDLKEDKTEGAAEYTIYAVINSSGSAIKKIETFNEQIYSFDQDRDSWPWKRHVYSAFRMISKSMVISFSLDLEKAIEENDRILRNLTEIKKKQQIYVNGFQKKIKDKDKMIAYKAACLSLDHLITNLDRKKGVYAGLWWFFQFWARDEAVSLKALIDQGKYDLAKEIIFRSLKTINKDGRLNLFYPPEKKAHLGNADAIGWLMKRVYDLFEALHKKKIITEYLSPNDIELIKNKVEDCIYGLIDKHTNDDLALNGRLETWMDTDYQNDYREGYRIEIQALRLNIYKLMKLMCKVTSDKIGESIAEKLEKDLLERVRKDFWNGNYLDDGLNDSTIRPNIFIAYYVYPELLTNSQWIKCFKTALPHLWNTWGGLSTIDKENRLYCDRHTGEKNQSYHRGDSWYWINNLAALCMTRLSKLRFSSEISKIADASTKEMLWSGAIGHHAEISSSAEMQSKGCLMQAWSAAMYVE